MMRTAAWIFASIAISGGQVSPGGKPAAERPVPVEASAAIRKSLAACEEPTILDVLPDPVKYPELHAKEAEQARENLRLREFAGYPCYVAEAGDAGELLDTLSASKSLRATANRERFWPEKLISWGKGKEVRRVAWSMKSNEVVFLAGEEQMRYDLAPEAVEHLRSTVGDMRVMRPDALEEAAPLLDALKPGAQVTVHEGTQRFGSRASSEEALKLRGEWLIDGFQFMKTGTVDRDTKALSDLIRKEGALTPWRGIKMCGAFHPDFAITWKVGERNVSLLICFTCHEAIFTAPGCNLLYDLPQESYEALKAELEKFRPPRVEAPRDK